MAPQYWRRKNGGDFRCAHFVGGPASRAPADIRRDAIYYWHDHAGGLIPERCPDCQIVDWIKVPDGGVAASRGAGDRS